MWLIEQIAKLKDERLIKAIKSLLETVTQSSTTELDLDFWDALSEDQKKKIENAILEMDEGKGIPHDLVMEEFRTRYQNGK